MGNKKNKTTQPSQIMLLKHIKMQIFIYCTNHIFQASTKAIFITMISTLPILSHIIIERKTLTIFSIYAHYSYSMIRKETL